MNGSVRPAAATWAVALVVASGCATTRDAYLAESARLLRPVPLEALEGTAFSGFLSPGRWAAGGGLFLLEPYRPGAIPVVLIHGLASDPGTWEELHAGLRADPWVRSRFQFWAFRYPTGPTYLKAAADLREQMARVRQTLDPQGRDAALRRIVLVGHSMGGLVAKLQVTHSDEHVWRTFSNGRPEDLRADPEIRHELTRAAFFEPQPGPTRVVSIATPHRGSDETLSRLGLWSRRLVFFPEPLIDGYERLLKTNRALLSNLPGSPPTSVEHLEPRNPVLLATTRLRYGPGVSNHTIIGIGERTGRRPVRDGDGYVTIDSATLPGAQTEKFIVADHTEIHRHPAAITEVRRILYRHAAGP